MVRQRRVVSRILKLQIIKKFYSLNKTPPFWFAHSHMTQCLVLLEQQNFISEFLQKVFWWTTKRRWEGSLESKPDTSVQDRRKIALGQRAWRPPILADPSFRRPTFTLLSTFSKECFPGPTASASSSWKSVSVVSRSSFLQTSQV